MNKEQEGEGNIDMANNNLLRRLLIDEEGCKLEAYKDSKKKLWHIGIGHNLEIDQTDEELEVLTEYDEENLSGLTITEQEAHTLFDIDVQDAIEDVSPFFTAEQLETLGETRRAIIIGMVFQQGGAGVRKYKNFKSAVLADDWEMASHEMVTGSKGGPSRWMIQTPERCQRAADAMKVGYFALYEEVDAQDLAVLGDSALSAFTNQELIMELSHRFNLEVEFKSQSEEG